MCPLSGTTHHFHHIWCQRTDYAPVVIVLVQYCLFVFIRKFSLYTVAQQYQQDGVDKPLANGLHSWSTTQELPSPVPQDSRTSQSFILGWSHAISFLIGLVPLGWSVISHTVPSQCPIGMEQDILGCPTLSYPKAMIPAVLLIPVSYCDVTGYPGMSRTVPFQGRLSYRQAMAILDIPPNLGVQWVRKYVAKKCTGRSNVYYGL